MSTTQSSTSILTKAFALVQGFIQRATAPAAPAKDTSDLWQLFRMARGSDSVRPAVIRMLAEGAGRP